MAQGKEKKIFLARKNDLKRYRSAIDQIISKPVAVLAGNLNPVVQKMLKKRKAILGLTKKHETPFYIFDQKELENSIQSFTTAFNETSLDFEFYYAVKVNHHPYIIKNVLKNNFGLDVSSGRELEIALENKAKKILFTGPGKTSEELSLVLKNNQLVTVNLDSFDELVRLSSLVKKYKKPIKAGIRIFTNQQQAWNKFGIPLKDLKKFWQKTKKYPLLKLQGIHFHNSWNPDASSYVNSLSDLAKYLKNNFSQAELAAVNFIDIGGGFRPFQSEGYFPESLPQGELLKVAANYLGESPKFTNRYFITQALPIQTYAKDIISGIKKHLKPIINCKIYLEPGRIICNNAFHVVFKILDLKGKNQAIADAGIYNLIGWERFEYDYFPLINLTHPALREIRHTIFGSLCMPQDNWGNYCYAAKISKNDIILVPYQGALTYSIAQNFIKPIPPVYILK